jgi:hypothetical protein
MIIFIIIQINMIKKSIIFLRAEHDTIISLYNYDAES